MKDRITPIALACVLNVTSANATLLKVSPTVDGFALSSTSWTAIDTTSDFLLAQLSATAPEARSALEFAITGIPSGVVVNSATLGLWGSTADRNIGVHGYTGNGTLESGDFSLSNEITQFDPSLLLNAVNVTSFIQGQYAAASPFAGFQLRELQLGEVTEFRSNEDVDVNLRPYLDINYTAAVPEPATLALLSLGLAGLGFSRRKQ